MKTKKWIIISLICLISISSIIYDALYIKPHKLTIREETLKSNKLSNIDNDLLIAYFSDLHYGLYTSYDDLDKLVDTINNADPDIVIFSGDLFDNYLNITDDDKEYVKDKLLSINSKLNKYAVLGEKDLISNDVKTHVEDLLQEANFEIITNKNVSIYKDNNFYFNLIGIDSLDSGVIDSTSAFDGVNSSTYNLAVSHTGDSFKSLDANMFDYFIGGHSHGIQIYFPLINYFYRPYGSNTYCRGKYHKNNTTIDITSGVGLKEKSIRLFTDAEVVFYKIKAN